MATYTTIYTLLEAGITGIVHVQPSTPVSCFNNKTVLGIVEGEMESAGKSVGPFQYLYGPIGFGMGHGFMSLKYAKLP